MNLGFPDVCNTIVGPATVPIPYPNIAMNAQATPFSPNVKITMMNALNLGSKIPMTSGDEAGTAHPMIKQAGAYTMGNPIVSVNNLPAINLTCPTTGNNMNNAVGAVLVPSAVNVFYTYRRPEQMNAGDLEALHDSLNEGPPVSGAVMLPGEVGYLQVLRFTFDLSTRVYNAIREMEGRGMRSLVLDLRGNPGGEMQAFIRLAGDFLAPGSLIVTMTDGDGDTTEYRARQEHPYAFPLALLVDRWTASAAELFAGCMQSHARAVIVGETTYGKGIAQSVVPALDAPGVVYASVASFTLPHGEQIHGVGVKPDWVAGSSGPAWAEAAFTSSG
jgi:carboxyl-terminal processing protease